MTWLTVIATRVGSRCDEHAEYARRTGSPPSSTRSVKNWPGRNAMGAPLEEIRATDSEVPERLPRGVSSRAK